ncbi:MAG: glycosyltransferase family 2 protein [archaeon]|jgi:dolichol-phosphate mannosyltransferase|nr:glycosyltransferase family 2 protein [archaeon]
MTQVLSYREEHFQVTDKVGVVIPVYGESDSIVWVLNHFPKGVVDTICLVIDVPIRKIMNRVRGAAEQSAITTHIIKNPERMGVGLSILQGLEYLRKTNHSIAVVMAGNGKDDPRQITRLTKPIIKDEADYVQGSRYLFGGGNKGKMPFVRRVFNRLYPKVWSLLTGKNLTDVTNGFRAYRLDLLNDKRINLKQEWLYGYSLEYYFHYKVISLRYRMKEVPVSKRYPFGHKGGYSKIQPLKDWWPIISPLGLLFFGVKK